MRLAAALALAMVLSACSAAATPSPAPTAAPALKLAGTLTLASSSTYYNYAMNNGQRQATDCYGTGGYVDIKPGVGVTAKDEAGKIVGTGTLALDRLHSAEASCVYTFAFDLGPGSFYSLTVANRPGVTYAAADLAAKGYKVDLTLGK